MAFTNGSVKLCTFCYKSVLQFDNEVNQQNNELCAKFYKNLNSFVINRTSCKEISTCKLVSCRDCEFLIGEFCEVHDQIKQLELKLQRKLEMLMKVMKSADKVPSRVKALEQSFSEIESSIEIRNADRIKSHRKDYNSKPYQLFRNLRQEILNKCFRSRNISQLQPRVVLNRIICEDKTKSKKKRLDYNAPPNSFIGFEFVIGWLWSFGSVVLLQSLYSDYQYDIGPEDVIDSLDEWYNDGHNLDEILEEGHDKNVIIIPFASRSNNNIEDTEYEEWSPIEQDENVPINITSEIENDSTSVTSDETPEDILNFKEEPISEVNPNDIRECKEKIIKNLQTFSYEESSLKLTSKKSSSSKTKLRRCSLKWKRTKAKSVFSCGVCKKSYKTYQLLRRHKFSAIHLFLEKKWDKNLKTTSVQNFEIPKDIPESKVNDNRRVVKEDEHTLEDSSTVTEEINSTRYNLRLRTKTTVISTSDQESDINSDVEEEKTKETDSSYTSSSSSEEESSIDDFDICSTSSKIKHENEDMNENVSENSRVYRCLLDDCKVKGVSFYKKRTFDHHTKLHSRGEYQCNFCDKVEDTPINLSLHETEMHSAIPSTSSNMKLTDRIFYCARCPFETQTEGIYLKHFASTHLDIRDGETINKLWECDICNRKFVRGKSLIKNHFKTHHDTRGLEDSETKIKKCKVVGCSAYFLSYEQLRVHKELQHSSFNSSDQLDEFVYNIIETNDKTGLYKCSVCLKESKLFFNIRNHVRTNHFEILIKQAGISEKIKSGKRFVCPELKCTKTFQTTKGLEIHEKCHGTFACLFCDDIQNYAPDLAKHENEVHAFSIPKTEDQQPKKIPKFRCSRCTKRYHYQSNYIRHFINDHLEISTIHSFCSICNYECHIESLRSHHLRYHYTAGIDPTKIPRCTKCSAFFRTFNQLNFHIEKLHPDPRKRRIPIRNCIHCDATFKSSLQLEKHLDKEHPYTNISSEFKCKLCNRYFGGKVSLKNHTVKVHSGKPSNQTKSKVSNPYFCVLDRCKRKFQDEISFKLHQNLHKRDKYPCKFCDLTVNSVLELSRHESSKHPRKDDREKITKGIYYCSRCPYKIKSAKRFETHFAKIHLGIASRKPKYKSNNDKPLEIYECKICKKEHHSISELGYHEAEHVNNIKFKEITSKQKIQCSRCPRWFTKLYYIKHFLKTHFNGSTKGKRTVCQICQKIVTRGHFRQYHDTNGLEDPSNVYKCIGEDDKCKAYFIKYIQLLQHKRIQHPVLEWRCKDCGKSYKSEKTLKMHKRDYHFNVLKNPELPFLCDVEKCEKGFETKEELEYHKQFARCRKFCNKILENPIKCDKCDKEFSSVGKLNVHVSQIHSIPSFICAECGKAFKLKAQLQTHSEFHKGPEAWKFQCSDCGKKCVTKYTLNAHLRTHTGEKPYVCQYCGEKYAHIHNWKNHMLTKHKNQDDLPEIRKCESSNRLSRKGTKKGDCIVAGVKQ